MRALLLIALCAVAGFLCGACLPGMSSRPQIVQYRIGDFRASPPGVDGPPASLKLELHNPCDVPVRMVARCHSGAHVLEWVEVVPPHGVVRGIAQVMNWDIITNACEVESPTECPR